MKTIKHNNPTIVNDVHHDFVCPKENFGINSKMFRSDAREALNPNKDVPKVRYQCEFDSWSPNESMR